MNVDVRRVRLGVYGFRSMTLSRSLNFVCTLMHQVHRSLSIFSASIDKTRQLCPSNSTSRSRRPQARSMLHSMLTEYSHAVGTEDFPLLTRQQPAIIFPLFPYKEQGQYDLLS